jgi:hypothetical protein
MRVSEALDLGSIPNATTKTPVSKPEMGVFIYLGYKHPFSSSVKEIGCNCSIA